MSRLPLVVSDLPYVREVVDEFGIGTAFTTSEPGDIAAALMSVLDRLDQYKERVDLAAKKLCWENEEPAFLDAMAPALKGRQNLHIVCVANKRLTTNRRVFRHTRTLAEMGHKLTVIALFEPVESLKDPRITYHALKCADPLARLLVD
jgi:hypothetical protein